MSDDPAPTPVARDGPPGGRPHLMLVSADPDLRRFLHEGLQLAGFWVSAIGSGLQAIEVLRLRAFDLVLLDGRIGGLPAAEIVRRLRPAEAEGAARSAGPVVVVDPDPEDIADGRLGAAVDLLVVPPIDLTDLAPALMTTVLAWRAAHPERPWADAPARAAVRGRATADG